MMAALDRKALKAELKSLQRQQSAGAYVLPEQSTRLGYMRRIAANERNYRRAKRDLSARIAELYFLLRA